jgi:hypothetical protein
VSHQGARKSREQQGNRPTLQHRACAASRRLSACCRCGPASSGPAGARR